MSKKQSTSKRQKVWTEEDDKQIETVSNSVAALSKKLKEKNELLSKLLDRMMDGFETNGPWTVEHILKMQSYLDCQFEPDLTLEDSVSECLHKFTVAEFDKLLNTLKKNPRLCDRLNMDVDRCGLERMRSSSWFPRKFKPIIQAHLDQLKQI